MNYVALFIKCVHTCCCARIMRCYDYILAIVRKVALQQFYGDATKKRSFFLQGKNPILVFKLLFNWLNDGGERRSGHINSHSLQWIPVPQTVRIVLLIFLVQYQKKMTIKRLCATETLRCFKKMLKMSFSFPGVESCFTHVQ